MGIINIQINVGLEVTQYVSEIRKKLRVNHNLDSSSIITNGYVLNSVIRELKDKISFDDINYWEKVNKAELHLINTIDKSGYTMKFRLSSLSNEIIDSMLLMLSEVYGSRIRKSFVVKLILKAYLIENT